LPRVLLHTTYFKGSKRHPAWCNARELKVLFVGRGLQDTYLDVVFNNELAYSLTEREQLAASGRFNLLCLYYRPHKVPFPEPTHPWAAVKDPIVIQAMVYPLPRSVAAEWGITGTLVTDHIRPHLDILTPDGLPSGRWILNQILDTQQELLTCEYFLGHSPMVRTEVPLTRV
jgi:hypothetical protein